jgi:CHAD domain-containing protein
VAVEREVKLVAWPGFALPDLDDVVPGARARRTATIDLDATYMDSDDLRLGRSGITLRHRRRGPKETWTLKLPLLGEAPAGPGLARDEIDRSGSLDAVPDELVLLAAAHLRGARLRKVARLATVRRTTVVEGPDGEPLVEVDDDEVSVMDGGRVAARFREVEVEVLSEAGVSALAPVVDRLCRAGAEVGEPRPKLAQALGPRFDAPPEVVVPELPDEPTAALAVTAALAASVRRIVDHHPIAVLGDDPEGVHQMRVGARRLRSDLKTFRPLLDRAATDPLRAELKELGEVLGAVRDPDVQQARLRAGAARVLDPDDAPALEVVLAELDAERERGIRRMHLALASPRYAALLDSLVALAAAPPLTDEAHARASDVLPGLVRTPWKRLRSMVRDLGSDPPDHDLHEVRKRAKQVRYAAEAVTPVVGSKARKAARRVAGVQDVLGDHQDTVVAEARLRAHLSRLDASPAADGAPALSVAFALGALVGDERAERAARRAEWPAAWERASDPDRWRWLR